MNYPINDAYFRVEVLSKTERPNLLSYLAMHQCYAENPIYKEIKTYSKLSEEDFGLRVVDKCIKFGHWSVIEHANISFLVSGFPHSVLGQITRHRHLSFSVQSQRYTGLRISKCAKSLCSIQNTNRVYDRRIIEPIFYFRPVGEYRDREGKNYSYTLEQRDKDITIVAELIIDYDDRMEKGHAPEHARDLLPQNIRQDFVVTMNARSLLHFCDLRLPADAQPEIRTLAQMIFEKFEQWMPSVAEFYKKNRYAKNKLSP